MTETTPYLYPSHTNTQAVKEIHRSDTEITHQPWFHYKIRRNLADLLVSKNGEFLVRESISQVGSYTLVVHWAGETINFLINSTEGADGRPEYKFTSKSFSTVAEVIWHHVETGYPVSDSSPAVLLYPIDREITSQIDNTYVLSSTSVENKSSPNMNRRESVHTSRCYKGKNITSGLSVSSLSPSHLLDVSDTKSAHYLQIMAVVKSILFSSKAVYISHTLQQYTPSALAIHLTRTDLQLTQLSADKSTDRLGATGLQRLLLPYNECLQREAWFRHLQIKYLVILAVFGAVTLETRITLISQLIALARELSAVSLGNAFSFMSVMEALLSPHVSKLSSTWCALKDKFAGTMSVFELQLKPLAFSYFSGVCRGTDPPPVVPYIQPVLYNLLLSVQDVQSEDSCQRKELESGLDAFLSHFEAAVSYSAPREGLTKLQEAVNSEKEDSTLKHFLQQNHVKTLLNKIDRRFQDDWEMYDCAETLCTILSSLMTDY